MRRPHATLQTRPSDRPAFTLVELLLTITIIALLTAIMVPSLAKARQQGRSTVCAGNLHQLGLATNMYLDEHNDAFWPYKWDTPGSTNWWFGSETGGPHVGQTDRLLDRNQSILATYIENVHDTFLCPGFPYNRPSYYPKFRDRSTSYGYNVHLAPGGAFSAQRRDRIARPDEVFVFADGVHFDFYADRLNEPPYIYYAPNTNIRTGYGHFRHNGLANVLYLDRHVEPQPLRGPAYPFECNGPAGNLSDPNGGNALYHMRPVPSR